MSLETAMVSRVRPLALGGASLALGFVVWYLISHYAGLPSYVLPTPGEVLVKATGLWKGGVIQIHFAQTMAEIIQGAALGLLLGIIVALTFHRARRIRRLSMPVVFVMQVIPKISIAPLLVLWMGLGIASKITLVTLAVFFPVMINLLNRLESIPTSVRDLAKVLGFGPIRRAFQIEIPFTLPGLVAGLKLGLLGAVTASVIAEFIGASAGLGYLERQGQDNADISTVFISLGLLSLIGLVFYVIVVLFERRLSRRYT